MHPTRSNPSSKRLLTYREVAGELSVCQSTVCNLVKRGILPVVRVGRATRIPAAALEKWLNAQTMTERRDDHVAEALSA